jgi:hypothetical protein
MRYGLLDLLFAVFCSGFGAMVSISFIHKRLPSSPTLTMLLAYACGIGIYLALVYPVYRGLKLFPLVLPKCPFCGGRDGYLTNCEYWPRVNFQCTTCNGEFAVWHNGKPGLRETWEKPVLALKWPYALGRYCTMHKPKGSSEAVKELPTAS